MLWLVRLVIVLLLVRLLMRVAPAVWRALAARSRSEPSLSLVRDPFCGTFIAPSRALTVRTGGEVRYFCSERCREAYAAEH